MAKREPARKEKPGEKEQSRYQRTVHQQDDYLKTSDEGVIHFPGDSTLEKHAALLADARSDRQRASLVTQLQQTHGNAYVQRLLSSRAIQAKLTVSQPGDEYEREADQVAEAVTQTSEIQRQEEEEELLQPKGSEIQRQPLEEEEEEIMAKPASEIQRQEEEEEIMMKPSEIQRQEEEEELLQPKGSEIQRQPLEEEEELLQPKASSDLDLAVSDDLEGRINAASGGGQPLPDSVSASLEPQFGRDFSGVNIHTDTTADELSRQLGAEAFTTGRDVFFREGTYQPETERGKGLIAHELTHVVQQQAVPMVQRKASEEVPDISEATFTAVDTKIKATKYAEALTLLLAAVKASKMADLTNAKCAAKPVIYDSAVGGEGITDYKTWDPVKKEVNGIVIKMGDAAFTSVAWLYSSMMHEYQHLKQFITAPVMKLHLKEFEAYSWEILHAHETGVKKDNTEMKDLGKRLKDQGWDKMDADEQTANQATYDKAIKVIQTATGENGWAP